ncbi:MAG: precorrin-2 C(20)-methyltransferase, partial [Desulfuromonadales bacterium]
MSGRLIAVGVGPGDPELITLKGARLIREADVVIAPVGDNSTASVAHGIIDGLVDPRRQQLLTRVFPMKKELAEMRPFWEAAAVEVAGLLAQGKTVVFATLGDPFLYSTFLYFHQVFAERFPGAAVEVVPGISSIHAAAAVAGRPLGLGADRIAILPATFEQDRLRQTLREFDTVVLMKVHRVFDQVRNLLRELGRLENAVYVRRVGLPGETVIRDLDQIQVEDLDYLSLVLVG